MIWNLPPVMSLDLLGEHFGTADRWCPATFGKLDAMRQRMLAWACTMAGAVPAASTPAMPALRTNERRSMNCSPTDRSLGECKPGQF